MIKYRDYQIEAVESIFESFRTWPEDDVIAALPTGTGKSLIIAGIAQYATYHYPRTRIVVATHVKELVGQNHKQLTRLWPTAPAGIYSAGLGRRDTNFPITFVGIASVAKRAAEIGYVNLLVIDEAHLVSPKDQTMYNSFIAALRKINPNMRVIGLSATPYRLGLGSLTEGGLFKRICYDLTSFESFEMLLERGYLAPLTTKATSTEIDVAELRTVAGEYNQNDVGEAVDRIIQEAMEETIVKAADRSHWLIFAASIDNCDRISAYLDSRGISNVIVHSKMSDEVRDRNIELFKSGKVRAAINLNVLTTGFDYPDIDCIVILRPTKSTGLWVQMLGRGTRPAFGKENCLVLDFAGNRRRLGPINDPIIPKKKASKKGSAPFRDCPECGTRTHASRRTCPFCYYEFPVEVRIFNKAEEQEMMRGRILEVPIVPSEMVWFDVDLITYQLHRKEGKPPSLAVQYKCGLRSFKEWVCFEHTGFPRRKAEMWWRARSPKAAPALVEEALEMTDELVYPRRIQVKVYQSVKMHPEIMDYEFEPTEEEDYAV